MDDSIPFDIYDKESPITKREFKEEMDKYVNQMVNKINKPVDTQITILEKQIAKLQKEVDKLKNSPTKQSTNKSKKHSNSKSRRLQSTKPNMIVFKTGESYNIKYWWEILPITVRYLIKNNKFKLTDEIKNFINKTPQTKRGSIYRKTEQIGGYYLNLHGSTSQFKDRVKLLLESCNIDSNTVSYSVEEDDDTIIIAPPIINEIVEVVSKAKPIPEQPTTQKIIKPPKTMIFPDGKRYNIQYWYEMTVSTAVHLINQENLVIIDEIKDFINTSPHTLDGYKYETPDKIGNYYINKHGTSWQHQEYVDLLLKTHNIDIDSIIYETIDGKKYIKPMR